MIERFSVSNCMFQVAICKNFSLELSECDHEFFSLKMLQLGKKVFWKIINDENTQFTKDLYHRDAVHWTVFNHDLNWL